MSSSVMLPVLAVALVFVVAGLILFALHAAALRAGDACERARSVVVRAGALLGGWLAVTTIAALSGFTANFDARPPRILLVLGASILGFALATRSAVFTRLLDAMPRWWLVAIDTMRIPIELGLWALFLQGRFPVHLTLEGRNFDLLAGLAAPLVAWGVARGKVGARGLVAWNLGGLALLANIVGMAITTMPGPLQLSWPGPSNVIVASWPYLWLPTFLVPVALFGHLASLRQITRSRATETAAGREASDGPSPAAGRRRKGWRARVATGALLVVAIPFTGAGLAQTSAYAANAAWSKNMRELRPSWEHRLSSERRGSSLSSARTQRKASDVIRRARPFARRGAATSTRIAPPVGIVLETFTLTLARAGAVRRAAPQRGRLKHPASSHGVG